MPAIRSTRYEVRWPIADDTLTVRELIAEARPELHRIASRERVMVIPPVDWSTRDGDDGLELVASAGACLLDDIAEHARAKRAVVS